MVGFLNSGDGKPTRKNKPFVAKEGPRYEKPRVYYNWIDFHEGRVSLCALLSHLLSRVSEDDLRQHTITVLGMSNKAITEWLIRTHPEVHKHAKRHNGVGITESMVNGRIENMRRCNKTNRHILGDEYPKNHPMLKDLFPIVDAMLKKNSDRPGCLEFLKL